MRILGSVVLAATVVACHRSSELDGVYLSGNGSGTFFPCDSVNVAFMVPDSGLAAQSYAVAASPGAVPSGRGCGPRPGAEPPAG